MSLVHRVMLLGCALLFGAEPAAGQASRLLRDQPCSSCRIEVERVALLGDGDRAYLTGQAIIARMSDGRFLISDGGAHPGQILLFGPDGRYVNTIGRSGDGPGEFRRISFIHARSDGSVAVIDARGARLSILSPDLEFMASHPWPALRATASTLSGHDHVIVAGEPRVSQGMDLAEFSLDGELVASFGGTPDSDHQVRSLVVDESGNIWSLAINRYEVRQYAPDHSLVQTLLREVDWFEPWPTIEVPFHAAPPPTLGRAIWVQDSLVWTVADVAAADWQKREVDPSDPAYWADDPTQYNLYFDTVVEAIDPRTATVLASKRLPFASQAVDGGPFLASLQVDGEGNPYFELWQVRMTQETDERVGPQFVRVP